MLKRRANWETIVAGAVMGVLMTPELLFAQAEPLERPRRPQQGLFGPRTPPTGEGHQLGLAFSLFGVYDDNLVGDETDPTQIDPRFQDSGYRAGLNASLGYQRRWERGTLDAGVSSAAAYYPGVDDDIVSSHSALLGFMAPLGQHTRLRASQVVSYAPFYTIGLFPPLPGSDLGGIEVERPGFDQSVADSESYTSDTSVDLSHALSIRSDLTAFGSYRRVDTRDNSGALADLDERRVGGRFTRRFTRDLGLRAGYAYRKGGYGSPLPDVESPPVESHDIDLGIDYARAFSFSRRTTFTASTGSSITRQSQVTPDGSSEPSEAENHYYLLANAELVHEIGRTWSARAGYVRNLQFVQGLGEPVLSDSAVASIGGLLTRRLDAIIRASYSNGAVGFGSSDNGYASYAGTAGLRYALTETLAVYGEYFIYHYDFGDQVGLPPGSARELDRQGARVGLQVWVPLIQ